MNELHPNHTSVLLSQYINRLKPDPEAEVHLFVMFPDDSAALIQIIAQFQTELGPNESRQLCSEYLTGYLILRQEGHTHGRSINYLNQCITDGLIF